MSPSCVRHILDRHPDLNLVICHLFFPVIEEAFHLAETFPKIYLDLTGVPITIRNLIQDPQRAQTMKERLKKYLHKFPNRIIYGTDYPVGGGTPTQLFQELDRLGLKTEEMEQLTL